MAKAVTPRAKKAAAPIPNTRRQQRRLEHHDLSRGQLLDAAEAVFGRKGFHETTLKEVAELAEFAVGSVYSFFENKDDLFRQVFVRRGEQFMPALRDTIHREGPPVQLLGDLVDFEVSWFRQHHHFGRLYLRYASSISVDVERQVDRAMASNFEEAMALQAELFRSGQ